MSAPTGPNSSLYAALDRAESAERERDEALAERDALKGALESAWERDRAAEGVPPALCSFRRPHKRPDPRNGIFRVP